MRTAEKELYCSECDAWSNYYEMDKNVPVCAVCGFGVVPAECADCEQLANSIDYLPLAEVFCANCPALRIFNNTEG